MFARLLNSLAIGFSGFGCAVILASGRQGLYPLLAQLPLVIFIVTDSHRIARQREHERGE
jgi:hypothetical protein